MTVRFDEVELFKGPALEGTRTADNVAVVPAPAIATQPAGAPPILRAARWRRVLAFGTDLSLFLALGLAMSPLLNIHESFEATVRHEWLPAAALAAFLLLVSFYYFVVCWALWGKTVGGSIFDTWVGSKEGLGLDFRASTIRWAATLISTATLGFGFAIAILPGGRSLPDLMSGSRSFLAR